MPKGIFKRTPEMYLSRKGNKNALGKRWKVKDTSKYIGQQNGSGNKGNKLTEQHKKKIGDSNKGKNLGKNHTTETRDKMSEAQRAEKNHNWQGGKSFEPYSTDWTDFLKVAIRERDHYICQICKNKIGVCVHHIDYNKKNCNPANLITLCYACHSRTNYNRKDWTKFFTTL